MCFSVWHYIKIRLQGVMSVLPQNGAGYAMAAADVI
jgi:hypothetical protein